MKTSELIRQLAQHIALYGDTLCFLQTEYSSKVWPTGIVVGCANDANGEPMAVIRRDA